MIRGLGKITMEVLRVMDRPVATPLDGKPRGVALVLSLITIVILSTAVIEFTYSSRVNTAMATNERDNLKSYFLAKSGVNLSRLLLGFQYALQAESRETDDEMGQLIGRAMRRSNFQLYQYVDLLMGPFNSGRVEIPLASIDLQGMGVGGFGEFTGRFDVDVEPEEGRIDLNRFAREEIGDEHLIELCTMLLDERYDWLFERRDNFGELMDRGAIIQNIVNFIDLNEEAIMLGDDCTIRGKGGDERRPYDRDDRHDNEPRNSKLTHVEELHMVHGVHEDIVEVFGDSFTVYNVGRPNLNVTGAPVFYAVLCQNLQLEGQRVEGVSLCSQNREVAMEVLYLAMALDGVRAFFESPLSVLMAYVGTTESKLLPSAQVGQPVAFLSVSQLPSYIQDLKNDPLLMAQFIGHSPTYQRMLIEQPSMAVDPLNPNFPNWSVEFHRSGLMRSVTTRTPMIFRIRSTGSYGTSVTEIEAVIDFGKTIRRLPDERLVLQRESNEEIAEELRQALREEREQMPRGRVLYWRVE